MSGRFFSSSLLISVLLLIERQPNVGRLPQLGLACAMVGLMFTPTDPLWLTMHAYAKPENIWKGNGIVDERHYYFDTASLAYDTPSHTLRPWHQRALEGYQFRNESNLVIQRSAVGYIGYFAGPGTHIIDNWALCDPLLSRIPYRSKGKWRMGHFERKRPQGYEQAVHGDATAIAQPFLARLYGDLLLVTRGPLFAQARWQAIVRLNSGQYAQELRQLKY
jgi:arabinofuranosyltransferase